MADKPIDKKYLDGLVYRDAERKEVVEDGEKKVRYIPTERPLEPGDVLNWVDNGSSVTFATADGRKYTVDKSSKKADAPA